MSSIYPVFFENREKWRQWLENNHASETLVWVLFYKMNAGIPSMGYEEAVEEAVCFGWIDNLVRKIDEACYAQRFMPRRAKSLWSPTNARRALKMIAEEKMAPAGMATLAGVDLENLAAQGARTAPEVPGWARESIDASPGARECLEKLPPSTRATYMRWVLSAKKEATRRKRLAELIAKLERGEPLGMK